MVTKEAIYRDDSYDKNRILSCYVTRYYAFSKWTRLTFEHRKSIVNTKYKKWKIHGIEVH